MIYSAKSQSMIICSGLKLTFNVYAFLKLLGCISWFKNICGISCFVVRGLRTSLLVLFLAPIFPITGSLITTLFFLLEAGISYSIVSLFCGNICLRFFYSRLSRETLAFWSVLTLPLFEFPDVVDIPEVFELTEVKEEFKSATMLYSEGLFLKSWLKLILIIESVGIVGADNSKPP